jgi:hypothetical protein
MGRKEVRGFDSRPPPLHLTCVNGANERNSVQTPGAEEPALDALDFEEPRSLLTAGQGLLHPVEMSLQPTETLLPEAGRPSRSLPRHVAGLRYTQHPQREDGSCRRTTQRPSGLQISGREDAINLATRSAANEPYGRCWEPNYESRADSKHRTGPVRAIVEQSRRSSLNPGSPHRGGGSGSRRGGLRRTGWGLAISAPAGRPRRTRE